MDSASVAELKDLTPRLLYRDALMLVIDKPAGIAVHQAPRGGDHLEAHFDSLRFGLPRPPALAHRLDRDTSGCLVLGRHRKALQTLGTLFKTGKIAKTYWAVCEGSPDSDAGLIDLPLATLEPGRGWWMKVDAAGMASQTEWRVLARQNGLAWLELKPLTGRTHQLRVHCAAMGWPIVGDTVYGAVRGPQSRPLQLHARRITVPLYTNKPAIEVEAPVPAHMLATLASFKAP